MLAYEQHRGITRDHVLCRCSEDTVVLFRCRFSAQIVRNDGGTPRSPRGCLWPKVAPLAGKWWAAGEAYRSCRGLLCQLLVGSSRDSTPRRACLQPAASNRVGSGCCQAGAARRIHAIPITGPRGKSAQTHRASVDANLLTTTAAVFRKRWANHCSKLSVNCNERWLKVSALNICLLNPPRFVAQLRLLNQVTSISGLSTAAITELLGTELLALFGWRVRMFFLHLSFVNRDWVLVRDSLDKPTNSL